MQAEVRDWLGRRTSNGEDWDRHELVRAKKDTTVSVCSRPGTRRAPWAHRREAEGRAGRRVPLIDELIVMDAGSADETAAARPPREPGGPAGRGPDAAGRPPGKGEALWKSLYVSTGDLVVFSTRTPNSSTPSSWQGWSARCWPARRRASSRRSTTARCRPVRPSSRRAAAG